MYVCADIDVGSGNTFADVNDLTFTITSTKAGFTDQTVKFALGAADASGNRAITIDAAGTTGTLQDAITASPATVAAAGVTTLAFCTQLAYDAALQGSVQTLSLTAALTGKNALLSGLKDISADTLVVTGVSLRVVISLPSIMYTYSTTQLYAMTAFTPILSPYLVTRTLPCHLDCLLHPADTEGT